MRKTEKKKLLILAMSFLLFLSGCIIIKEKETIIIHEPKQESNENTLNKRHDEEIKQLSIETLHVIDLIGEDVVYWTKSGKKYHLYEDCHTINKDISTEIFIGKVADAYTHEHIDELCKICENRAIKEKSTGYLFMLETFLYSH